MGALPLAVHSTQRPFSISFAPTATRRDLQSMLSCVLPKTLRMTYVEALCAGIVLKGSCTPISAGSSSLPQVLVLRHNAQLIRASSWLPFLDCPQAAPCLLSSPTITHICTHATSPAVRSPSRSARKPARRPCSRFLIGLRGTHGACEPGLLHS